MKGAVQCPSARLGLELRWVLDERADGSAGPADRAATQRYGCGVDALFDTLVPCGAGDWVDGQHVLEAQIAIAFQADAGGLANGFLVGRGAVESDCGIGRDGIDRQGHLGATLGGCPRGGCDGRRAGMCTHQGLRLGASLRFARLHALWQFDATQLNRFWGGCPEVRAVVRGGGLQLHGARRFSVRMPRILETMSLCWNWEK